jgi:hypothetical protein
MMNGDGPKENANPIIHDVDNTLKYRKRQKPLGWSIIEKFNISNHSQANIEDDNDGERKMLLEIGGGEDDDHAVDWNMIRSTEDHAVYHALVDASAATNGKGVALLRSIGFVIPVTTRSQLQQPTTSPPLAFLPAELPESLIESIQSNQRDAVDAEEIFDIIKNIQDPEHPLTLEQLGVVSRNQIQVYDRTYELLQQSTNQEATITENSSTVDVRFT